MTTQNVHLLRNQRLNHALLSLAFIGLLTGCSTLHSDLTVQPGRQFVLGGNQKGAFLVKARNTGRVTVSLSERRASGQTVELGQFAPGDAQTVRFAAGSAVLIDNRADQSARLDLTVTGDKDNLTMQERTSQNP
jgi:hypothetical protein